MSYSMATPSPWKAYQNLGTGRWEVDNWSPRHGNFDGLIVADFGSGTFSKGNALLCAASPEMYAALECLEGLVSLAEWSSDDGTPFPEIDKAVNAARAALAKARGEAPK